MTYTPYAEYEHTTHTHTHKAAIVMHCLDCREEKQPEGLSPPSFLLSITVLHFLSPALLLLIVPIQHKSDMFNYTATAKERRGDERAEERQEQEKLDKKKGDGRRRDGEGRERESKKQGDKRRRDEKENESSSTE